MARQGCARRWLLAIGLAGMLLAGCAVPVPARLALRPCLPHGISAQCGTLSVYENRAAHRGRKIGIHVIIIPAGDAAARALYRPLTTSAAPVLIIDNQADPQNPPENVAGAKEHFPNSLTLIAPGQGHGYTGFACRNQIIADFIASGSTQGLKTGCLQQVPLPPFE